MLGLHLMDLFPLLIDKVFFSWKAKVKRPTDIVHKKKKEKVDIILRNHSTGA